MVGSALAAVAAGDRVKRFLFRLRPAEILAVIFVAAIAAVQWAGLVPVNFKAGWTRRALPVYLVVLGCYLVLCAFRLVVLRGERRPLAALAAVGRVAARSLRDWAPVLVLLWVYENALPLVAKLNPRVFDLHVFEMDGLFFGGHPDVWFDLFMTAGRTEWFSSFYDSYIFYPLILGWVLYLQDRRKAARNFLTAFVLSGFAGYVGYSLVPVVGPRYHFEDQYTRGFKGEIVYPARAEAAVRDHADQTDEGLFFFDLASRLNGKRNHGGQIPRNCFPSLHTAWAVVSLLGAAAYSRVVFLLFLFPLGNLIVSTMYLRFHYVTDVVAGTLLAIAVFVLVCRLHEDWEAAGRRAGLPPAQDPFPDPGLRPGEQPLAGRALALATLVPACFFGLCGLFLWLAEPEAAALARYKETIVERARVAEAVLPDQAVHTRFGEYLELLRADVNPPAARPGERVRLDLYWRCVKTPAETWRVFVHVVGASKKMVNADHYPVLDLYRFEAMKPGEVVRDSSYFKVDRRLGLGDAAVRVGLYKKGRWTERLAPFLPDGTPRGTESHVEVARLRVGQAR